MAEPINHTPYEWCLWCRRVVLFRRYALKPIWGLCLFVAGYLALTSLTAVILLMVFGLTENKRINALWAIPVFVLSIAFIYAFRKVYQAERGRVLLPRQAWRIGRGTQLSCQTLRIPLPTSMGGTLPGYPSRWLMVDKHGREPRRLIQVHDEPDLLKINCALAGRQTGPVSPSH